MNVSIFICTRDRAASLRETLGSIQQCAMPSAMTAEIVVIDNGSSDDTALIAQASEGPLPVRYRYDVAGGKSACLNRALAGATGEALLFTDDDVLVPSNWIAAMTAPIASGQADAVAGGIRIAAHLQPRWMTPTHRSLFASTEAASPNAPCLIGANMAISLAAFRSIGGFDWEIGPGCERGHAEDTLVWLQLCENGCRIAAAYDVIADHQFDSSRLSRASFKRLMQRRGEFNAYVAHHWFHSKWRFPHVKVAREWIRLQWKRALCLREWISHPAAPVWELLMMEGLHTFKQYIHERKLPRNYARRGLARLDANRS
jgi:glycosyltransferase involved in cell wall biosynthesis